MLVDAAFKAGGGRGGDGSVTGIDLVWSGLLRSDVALCMLQVCGKNRTEVLESKAETKK